MEGNTCPVTSPPVESPKPPELVNAANNNSPKVERDSPEPNCAICLGKTENKSFTDSCLHQFCFNCLLQWSKVKAECPLCKQSFKSIIHNVRSNEDYDQYHLHIQNPDPGYWPAIESSVVRVRYRTTLTAERQRERFLETFMAPYIVGTDAIPAQRNIRRRHRMFTSDFRTMVYRDNLWVNPLPDVTGRFRDCTPEFYRMNPAQVHRLAPWLNRELTVLRVQSTSIMFVMEQILNMITRSAITSVEFRACVSPHIGIHTDHFIHEFYAFARSPYDMMGFDQSAEYRERVPSYTYEVQPLSDSDSENDVIVLSTSQSVPSASTSQPSSLARSGQQQLTDWSAGTSRQQSGRLSPEPGPSGLGGSHIQWTVSNLPQVVAASLQEASNTLSAATAARNASLAARQANQASRNVNQTEVVDSDSDECVIVGYVKPRHERTPEIITLGSDVESVNDRASVDDNESELMFSSSSTSSDTSSDSDFVPYQSARQSTRKAAPKHKRVKKAISSTSEESDISLVRRKAFCNTESDSTGAARCRHKRNKSRSKGKQKCEAVVLETSDEEISEPAEGTERHPHPSQITAALPTSDEEGQEFQNRINRAKTSHRPVWRIIRKQEPETDHDYSLDCYDPPYTEEEVASFSLENRPKLRSIVISKSAGSGSQRECSYSPVPSSSRSSSRHHESRRHKHKSHKREERKKRERRRSSSSSPVRPSKGKRSRTRKVYSSSDSSS